MLAPVSRRGDFSHILSAPSQASITTSFLAVSSPLFLRVSMCFSVSPSLFCLLLSLKSFSLFLSLGLARYLFLSRLFSSLTRPDSLQSFRANLPSSSSVSFHLASLCFAVAMSSRPVYLTPYTI